MWLPTGQTQLKEEETFEKYIEYPNQIVLDHDLTRGVVILDYLVAYQNPEILRSGVTWSQRIQRILSRIKKTHVRRPLLEWSLAYSFCIDL